MQDPQYRAVFVGKHGIPETLWDVLPFPGLLNLTKPKRCCAPPSIFALPKWNLQELINFFLWRNMISFANHPIKPLATKIGRCLTLMVQEINRLYPSLPSLVGVRDTFLSLLTLDQGQQCTVVRERDVNNCDWEIPKKKALQAIVYIKTLIAQ